MTHKCVRISLVLVGLWLCAVECLASATNHIDSTSQTSTWLNIGFGWNIFSGSSDQICGRIGISHQRDDNVFTIRSLHVEEFALSFGEPRFPSPAEKETDFAVLYGRSLHAGSGYNAFSIGLGLVNSVHRGALLYGLNYETVRITSLGVSLDIQMFLTPCRYFGLGISLAGNLNPTRSFGAFILCLQLGDI